MEIRIATTSEEMEQVYRLRYQCYVEELGWKYDHADRKAKELRDDLDATGTIYYAADGERVVATYCLHFAGGFELPETWRQRYALERFADYPESSFSFSSRLIVLPEFRGSTVVPRMLMKAYEESRHRGTRFNFCWCRPRLIDLYERLGFIRYKDNIPDTAQGYVVPMILLTEHAEHLRAVRSPFHKICLATRPCTATANWFDRTFPGVREMATKQLCAPEDFWQRWAEAMDGRVVALLEGLSVEQERALLEAGTVLRCRKGDTLMREGEAGHEMFLILDGMARSWKQGETGTQAPLGWLGKGELFGEMAMLSRTKRTASVQAETDMQVLVISQEFLQRAMKALPAIAMRLLYNLNVVLSDKLRQTTNDLVESMRRSAPVDEKERGLVSCNEVGHAFPMPGDGHFPTTRWTLIARLKSSDETEAHRALDDLCAQYRYPLYCCIRRRGLGHHDAEDALHDFLAKLLRLDTFAEADAAKGHLRSFLATALQRFLINWHRGQSQRDREFSVDAQPPGSDPEERYRHEIFTEKDTPERVFDRKWGQELMQRVLRVLGESYAAQNKARLFATLRPVLLAGGSLRGEDSTRLAAEFGMTDGALRVALTRMLRDYRAKLEDEVRQTVDSSEAVKEELTHLLQAFRK